VSLIVGVFGVDGAETLKEAVVFRRIFVGVGVAAVVDVSGGNPFVLRMMVDGVGSVGVCFAEAFVVEDGGFVLGFLTAAAAAAATRLVFSLSLTSNLGLSPLPLIVIVFVDDVDLE